MKNRGPILAVKTKLQSHLIWLVFFSMAVPTLILGGGALVLVRYSITAVDGTTPEEMRARILLSICVLFPVMAAAIFFWAFHLTNRMVGPVERMINELDARLRGTASGPIVLRPKDLLIPLADRINLVIAEWENLKKPQGEKPVDRP